MGVIRCSTVSGRTSIILGSTGWFVHIHVTSCPLEFMNPINIHTTWPPCPLRSVVPPVWCHRVSPPAVLATNQDTVLVLYKNGHPHCWLVLTSQLPWMPTLLLAIQQIHHFQFIKLLVLGIFKK